MAVGRSRQPSRLRPTASLANHVDLPELQGGGGGNVCAHRVLQTINLTDGCYEVQTVCPGTLA